MGAWRVEFLDGSAGADNGDGRRRFAALKTGDFTHKTGLIEAFEFGMGGTAPPPYSNPRNSALLHQYGLARCKAQLREPASQDGFMADGRNARREIFVASEEIDPIRCRPTTGKQWRYFRFLFKSKGGGE